MASAGVWWRASVIARPCGPGHSHAYRMVHKMPVHSLYAVERHAKVRDAVGIAMQSDCTLNTVTASCRSPAASLMRA